MNETKGHSASMQINDLKSALLMVMLFALGCNLQDGTSVLPGSGSDDDNNTTDLVAVEFSAQNSSVAENVGSTTLTVTLAEALTSSQSVQYSVLGSSTAQGSGVDFTLLAGILTFDAGEVSKTINVTIVDDSLDEVSETILVQLASPSSLIALGAFGRHTLTVTDNDAPPTVQFTATSDSGSEGSTPAQIQVSLSTASGQTVTVDYTVSGMGTASGGGTDYTLANGTVTFPAGTTTRNISPSIANDSMDENDETIVLNLSNPISASLGVNTSHAFTIADDDAAPTVQFSSSSASVREKDLTVALAVSLSAASGKTVTVNYAAANVTATGGGTDYTLASSTLTFNPGETSKNISPTIVDERVVESAGETFTVTLSAPSNATLGATLVNTVTILDDLIASRVGLWHSTRTTGSTNINLAADNLQWIPGVFDATYFSEFSAHQIRIETAGDFWLAVTLPMTSAVVRANVHLEVYVNGAIYPGAISETGYIRNTSAHTESSEHLSLLLTGLLVGDLIQVRVATSATAGTVSIASRASLYLEHVASSRFLFTATAANLVGGLTDLNQAAATAFNWTSGRKDTGFTHSNGANPHQIVLDSSDDYMVSVNIPVQSVIVRPNLRVQVRIDGVMAVGAQASQGYIRSTAGHNEASLHWTGIVRAASAGSTLTVTTQIESAAGAVNLQTGKVASLMIEKLTTSANFYMGRATQLNGGVVNWNPAARTSVDWAVDEIIDSGLYTRPSNTQIQVSAAGDYLLIYSNVFTSAVNFTNPRITIEVGGITESGATISSHYKGQVASHSEMSGTMVFLLRDLPAGANITISAQQEAAAGTVSLQSNALVVLWKK